MSSRQPSQRATTRWLRRSAISRSAIRPRDKPSTALPHAQGGSSKARDFSLVVSARLDVIDTCRFTRSTHSVDPGRSPSLKPALTTGHCLSAIDSSQLVQASVRLGTIQTNLQQPSSSHLTASQHRPRSTYAASAISWLSQGYTYELTGYSEARIDVYQSPR